MARDAILILTMSNVFLGVRGLSLALLILAAIGRADLHASIAGSGHAVSGLGRLGRDLVRREHGDAVSSINEARANSRVRPPTTTS
jgi:hypothetical protein